MNTLPIYEFHCEQCERDFEQLFRRPSAQPDVKCPGCGGAEVTRKLSLFGMSSARGDGSERSGGSSCASCTASSCSGCRR